MKNLIKNIAFAIIVVLGVSTSSAQGLTENTDRPEVIAKKQTTELATTLGLDGDQERAVFRALVSKEVSYKKQVNGKDLNNAAVKGQKKEIDDALQAAMKKTLSVEQFKKWLNLQK